jgi:hypothetical protein
MICLATDSEQTHFFRVNFAYPVFKEERKVKIMFKVRLAVATLGLVMMLPAPSLFAQAANIAPAAPLPSQILTAKKVFIANIGEDSDLRIWGGGQNRTYNEFYAALKSCGRYELVTAPADSDLIAEVEAVSDSVEWHFKLVLLDPKTQTPLWTIYEPIKRAGLQKNRDKNNSDTINKLVSDLTELTAVPANASK